MEQRRLTMPPGARSEAVARSLGRPHIDLKILQYRGSTIFPNALQQTVRDIYDQCDIGVRFYILPRPSMTETRSDLHGDETLNFPEHGRPSADAEAAKIRAGATASHEVPVAFVQRIVVSGRPSPAGTTRFGLCAVSNYASYPANVLAHEVGHYFLGRGHVTGNPARLMSAVVTNRS
jgi:hypothetical protein